MTLPRLSTLALATIDAEVAALQAGAAAPSAEERPTRYGPCTCEMGRSAR